jgi:hypothetical protein
MRIAHPLALLMLLLLIQPAAGNDTPSESDLAGLRFRNIGPAFCSGRITDFAVNPDRPSAYYVATASGGLWKTVNAGTTWSPIFDRQGSYSIGCVTMDPSNHHVVWVGTGENNSQRSVSFGDGVYRSRDGGKSFQHMGLKDSEHIGRIVVHPENSNIVYVAAQGPLWNSGGDRGLYKTIDGGDTWERILQISDDTGINEVHMDPRDPDTLYASAYQRRRHVWTLLNGGPESGLHKSTDGGHTWRKLSSGIPGVDLGRIGLAIAPANPDVLYAIVEAAEGKSGVFRSTDRGETWSKRSSYLSSSPQYYNELVCDPVDVDRVYSLDTFTQISDDGGASFRSLGNHRRHVDDHALWIDPNDTDHLLIGGDGGIYESFDHGHRWDFKANLPLAQMYRVSVDESEPFYYVFGGTQDNNSFGGPSRTTNRAGILNEDWFITVGGDGYETVVDPKDPNILYAQWQYGGLIRYDRRSGEQVDIKPRAAPGEDPLVWNWDTPLILSHHLHTRLYFAANRLFRTDDRGHSWTCISPDLTRGLDRDQLPVMGRIWEVDSVSKNRSTSIYGNAVSLSESSLDENLLYVGTDDGVVSVTEDGGQTWRKILDFPGVPVRTYVSCLQASRHEVNTVYASFENHKQGDFKPYLLVSRDRGESWTSIASNLPDRHVVLSVVQDHEQAGLLFAGTEFGVFVSCNEGARWSKLGGGVPTIAIRDMDIQRRENDLVLASFGRGFLVLDDYSPLRHWHDIDRNNGGGLFPPKKAWLYIENSRLGNRSGLGSQGSSYFAAPNPPFGATCTYKIDKKFMTRKEKRKEAESKARKEGRTAPYPTLEELRLEDAEEAPEVFLTITDSSDAVVQRLKASREAGLHRITWNLRVPATDPISLSSGGEAPPWARNPAGPLALPGTYKVQLSRRVEGEVTLMGAAQEFEVEHLGNTTLAAEDREAAAAFQRKAADLQRAVQGTSRVASEVQSQLRYAAEALRQTPAADQALRDRVDEMNERLRDLLVQLRGDRTARSRQHATAPSIASRIGTITGNQWYTTAAPSQTELDGYEHAAAAFEPVLAELRKLVEEDLEQLQAALDQAKAPWTPGRLPVWSPQEEGSQE